MSSALWSGFYDCRGLKADIGQARKVGLPPNNGLQSDSPTAAHLKPDDQTLLSKSSVLRI